MRLGDGLLSAHFALTNRASCHVISCLKEKSKRQGAKTLYPAAHRNRNLPTTMQWERKKTYPRKACRWLNNLDWRPWGDPEPTDPGKLQKPWDVNTNVLNAVLVSHSPVPACTFSTVWWEWPQPLSQVLFVLNHCPKHHHGRGEWLQQISMTLGSGVSWWQQQILPCSFLWMLSGAAEVLP